MDNNVKERKKLIEIKFKLISSQHIAINAKVNNQKGLFILDTGASNTCVGLHVLDYFNMQVSDEINKAAGAGNSNMRAQISENNVLQIGKYKLKTALMVLDLQHVNDALAQCYAKPIHGIIGTDVFLKTKAIINYKNNTLFLEK